MFSESLLYALITGLSWSAIGIVLSRCAKKDFGVIPYSLLQSGSAAILCFLFYARPALVSSAADTIRLILVIASAAGLNVLAQYLVKCAMAKGVSTPVWAMAQAAMIVPFLSGLFFFHGYATLTEWLGILSILAGVLLPAQGCFRQVRNWFLPAICALLCYGTLQSLYLIPSNFSGYRDPAALRPMLVCFGNFAGWSILANFVKKRENMKFSRTVILTALVMALLHAVSVKTFFFALDGFSRQHHAQAVMPLMLGINLAGFGIYSLIVLKERRRRVEILSTGLIFAGLFLLAV